MARCQGRELSHHS